MKAGNVLMDLVDNPIQLWVSFEACFSLSLRIVISEPLPNTHRDFGLEEMAPGEKICNNAVGFQGTPEGVD